MKYSLPWLNRLMIWPMMGMVLCASGGSLGFLPVERRWAITARTTKTERAAMMWKDDSSAAIWMIACMTKKYSKEFVHLRTCRERADKDTFIHTVNTPKNVKPPLKACNRFFSFSKTEWPSYVPLDIRNIPHLIRKVFRSSLMDWTIFKPQTCMVTAPCGWFANLHDGYWQERGGISNISLITKAPSDKAFE